MLQYLTFGDRRFGIHPMPPHTRLNWEFYAVIKGKCAPVLPAGPDLNLRERQLWVFPPETPHGWKGEQRAECQIVCFHFAFVPSPLRELAQARRFQECPVNENQVARLTVMAQELRPHFEQPTSFSHIIFERALLELTFMALANVKEEPLPELTQTMGHKVNVAIAWYMEHLSEAPRIEDVACKLHISPSNLRQIFMLTLHESPQSAFKRLRLHRAMELMSESNLKLEAVAEQCGYSNASDFSRAFSREFKISPRTWRENDYRSIPGALSVRPWLGAEAWTPKKPFSAPV
jgi:AraC family transcriptional regulator